MKLAIITVALALTASACSSSGGGGKSSGSVSAGAPAGKSSSGAAPSTSKSASADDLVKDPKTLDICSLVGKTLKFGGRPVTARAFGLTGCSLSVKTATGSTTLSLDLLSLDTSSSASGTVTKRTVAVGAKSVTVTTALQSLGQLAYCNGSAPVGNQLWLRVSSPASGKTCAGADQIMNDALQTLGAGTAKQLDFPPKSLVKTDLCAAGFESAIHASVPALASAKGVASTEVTGCRWKAGSTGAGFVADAMTLEFQTPSGRVAGRRIWTLPAQGGTPQGTQCLVEVEHIPYKLRPAGPSGLAVVEALRVYVYSAGSKAQVCALAKKLATAAAPALPSI